MTAATVCVCVDTDDTFDLEIWSEDLIIPKGLSCRDGDGLDAFRQADTLLSTLLHSPAQPRSPFLRVPSDISHAKSTDYIQSFKIRAFWKCHCYQRNGYCRIRVTNKWNKWWGLKSGRVTSLLHCFSSKNFFIQIGIKIICSKIPKSTTSILVVVQKQSVIAVSLGKFPIQFPKLESKCGFSNMWSILFDYLTFQKLIPHLLFYLFQN